MIDSSAFRSTVLLHITIACWLQVSVVVSQERMTSETIFAPTTGAEKIASWRLHQKLKQDAPFRANWQLTGPVMCGGRIEAIACSPSKNPTVYVGAGSGGLWKTSGNWTSWKSIFDDQPTQAIGDVAVSKTNPNTVWVGTGEVLMARSAVSWSRRFQVPRCWSDLGTYGFGRHQSHWSCCDRSER